MIYNQVIILLIIGLLLVLLFRQQPIKNSPGPEQKDLTVPLIQMPPWLVELWEKKRNQPFPTRESQLQLVHELARQNVENDTGGPFGAAVFSLPDHRLVAVGVNSVMKSGQIYAHAEMMAISYALRCLNIPDLTGFELVSSCEPCSMCSGGFLWSKADSLIYGEPGTTARKIGFDEGDKPEQWADLLRHRKRQVAGPFPSPEGRLPFELYQTKYGKIY